MLEKQPYLSRYFNDVKIWLLGITGKNLPLLLPKLQLIVDHKERSEKLIGTQIRRCWGCVSSDYCLRMSSGRGSNFSAGIHEFFPRTPSPIFSGCTFFGVTDIVYSINCPKYLSINDFNSLIRF